MNFFGKQHLFAFAHGPLVAAIVAILLCSTGAIVYTNKTLQSIEENLPSTLLIELNSLSAALDSLNSVATSARIAAVAADEVHVARLRADVDTAHRLIVDLRNTYVKDNLIHASSFHAVAAPAIVDVRIWLAEGVSGWSPDSHVTLNVIASRISEAFAKASAIKANSQSAAQMILDSQRQRLETFQLSVNALFIFTVLLVCLLVFLLIRQRSATIRESEAKAELQRQHDLLDSLLQSVPQGIAVWDRTRNLLTLNTGFTAITGYGSGDLTNMHSWPSRAYPDPVYRQTVIAHWKNNSRNGAACQYQVTCKDGLVKDIEFRAVPLPDGGLITTLSDVTERNRREKELEESRRIEARAKKMESLGLLAGGVAHDLNNILSGIVSYPDLLLLDLKADDKLRRPIELIRESGLRAAAIVSDLLTVARGVAVEKEPLDLNAIVEEYLRSPEFETLSRHHPGVELACNLDLTLFTIIGSRAHIRKVLMNLVTNAAEATDSSGVVSIATANREIDRDAEDVELPEGRYAMLTVTDQGKGIADQDQEKIFEPFYSKKVMGRSGTGLGLTVVWNVIQDHHGFIRVSSSGQETTFCVFLPATSLPLRQQPATVDMSILRGNGELILVVDDTDTQRQITSSMLTQLGYRAASVTDGEEAVQFVRNQAVAVVILDMIMSPGISGRETYERLLRVSPGQKALIVSGYAETDDVRETLQMGAAAFLKKPLLIKDLALALQPLLADSRQA
ncbi:hybrid sensor histidine kinase/response regulator [Desulfofustis limnaeus]|uniref:histidine kinase n=1 Tax=Desulfofustis limnaeus TaxID=2740163 RepID=A0ABN6M584_9BACT|nr:response regulator [Desulfofustis limnaeus]MDX9896645.1 response regulator [Desulfofustis sp.]BDD86262.1 hypothetical protein DPPLL_06270 [Desulfofustis limnaeus]